ncbi:MAG: hypothetical protein N2C14_14525, partial [Planctomycetales bacterium]
MRVFAVLLSLLLACVSSPAVAAEPASPDYTRDVAPLLKKYCVGCHNDDDPEGKLSLETFAAARKGGKHGPALLPRDASASRMIRMLTGELKPAMPPEDESQPTAEEVSVLSRWIDSGAKGPEGVEPPEVLLVPKIPAAKSSPPVTALAFSPNGKILAVAGFGEVKLTDASDRRVLRVLKTGPGKINDLRFTSSGKQLILAGGITGLRGQASVW